MSTSIFSQRKVDVINENKTRHTFTFVESRAFFLLKVKSWSEVETTTAFGTFMTTFHVSIFPLLTFNRTFKLFINLPAHDLLLRPLTYDFILKQKFFDVLELQRKGVYLKTFFVDSDHSCPNKGQQKCVPKNSIFQ